MKKENFIGFLMAIVMGACALWLAPPADLPQETTASFIVQAGSAQDAADAVRAVGAEVAYSLEIINSVSAELTSSEVEALNRRGSGLRIYEDHAVQLTGKPVKDTVEAIDQTVAFSVVVGADRLHDEGIFGSGVAVAVLDTGIHGFIGLIRGLDDRWRQLGGAYDFTGTNLNNVDESGHGTHLTSIIGNNTRTGNKRNPGRYRCIAPDCDLVPTKAFAENGESSYSTVIRAMNWLLAYKDTYNIRVLNLSFSAPARSFYYDDPLNQAVMRAWQAGIVVVASAGNLGPDPMTIGVPGNVPYVITVGAMSDNYTPVDSTDDYLASFSSAGPTHAGFVKPDLVAPGGHVKAMMDSQDRISRDHTEFHDDKNYFTMSGTSQAAAVVSGIVALMLQADPTLTPDQVKYRLMASAHRAENSGGGLGYSVLQQGAGVVNAYDAVYTAANGYANRGMDIAKDLSGEEHYAGPVRQNPDGSFYIHGLPAEYAWDGSYTGSSAILWSDALTERASINVWVPQE